MKKAFTLIELLAVIIILAILALIVSPIISNVISESKIAASERSTEGYVKAVELAQMQYLLNHNGTAATDISQLSVEYSGSELKDAYIEFDSNGTVKFAILKLNGHKCFYENDGEIDCKKLIVTPNECFSFSEYNNEISIWDYNCFEGNTYGYDVITDVVIPEYINGKKVTVLSDSAFISNGLTSVDIPNTITEISSNSFAGNHLSILFVPDSVTIIGDCAFDENKLEKIILSKNLTQIVSFAFAFNQLTEVTIPENVTLIGEYAFGFNPNLTTIINKTGSAFSWQYIIGNNYSTVNIIND